MPNPVQTTQTLDEWLASSNADRANDGLLRTVRLCKPTSATRVQVDGQELIQFASNDYLGLTSCPEILDAIRKSVDLTTDANHRYGSGASPLISGYTAAHDELEKRLAKFEGTESALLFSTGYAANLGTISAIVQADDVIFSDALNHASIIDGCRLSKATRIVYDHVNMNSLESLLHEHRSKANRAFIVTDTLFSMDGDLAPLTDLCELADQYDASIIIDEAHATGVYGENGIGLAESMQVADRIAIKIGTLSKAIGGLGGFVTGSHHLIEYLRNNARSYIYSTSMPVSSAIAGLAALNIIQTQPERRRRVRSLAVQVRSRLIQSRFDVSQTDSPIIAIPMGTPEQAIEQSQRLRGQGLWVPAIRPPTVPEGKSMLRISLSSAHTDEEIDQLLAAIHCCHPFLLN